MFETPTQHDDAKTWKTRHLFNILNTNSCRFQGEDLLGSPAVQGPQRHDGKTRKPPETRAGDHQTHSKLAPSLPSTINLHIKLSSLPGKWFTFWAVYFICRKAWIWSTSWLVNISTAALPQRHVSLMFFNSCLKTPIIFVWSCVSTFGSI